MEDSKTVLCSFRFPWARERISSKCIENLGTRSQKDSTALLYILIFRISVLSKNLPCILGDRILHLQEGSCGLDMKYLGKRNEYFTILGN
jgi:hypothetical protein